MESLIRKYKPAKQPINFDPNKMTKEGLKEIGLEKIAKDLNQFSNRRMHHLSQIHAPQKELYVMILGNHSSGKSSFINWYVGEDIQRTSVSIETIEINLVMHGAKHSELQGLNTTKHLPFLKELYDKGSKHERYDGLLKNLKIKTSPSTNRHF
jgi:ribosome biogenesis GTPase A